jgi:hypothetical protein
MKINAKKTLKFVILLVSSLLIATASAAVYRYMEIQGTVTVGALKLIWIKGADAPSATIVGSIATIPLNVENNTLVTFTEVLFLKNNDTSISFNYNISITDTLSSSAFETANLKLYTNSSGSWSSLTTLDLKSTQTYSSISPLGPGKYIRFTIEIKAIQDGASDSFKVQVTYWPSS